MPIPKTPSRITVDFTGIEDSRAAAAHVPEGDYLLEVAGCQLKSKKDDESSKYLNWLFRIVQPSQYKGKSIYHITSLKQESLWNLRGLLVDMLGEDKVPKSSVNIPLEAIVKAKKKIGATLTDDTYQDKTRSIIAATFPASDYTEVGAEVETEGEDLDEVEELDVDDL